MTLGRGWRHNLLVAFAPLISDGPNVVLVMLILNQVPTWLVTILQGRGGMFLLYLAVGAIKNWRHYKAIQSTSVPDHLQTVLRAALVNLLNPNPYLGWRLIMGPLLFKGWRETPAYGIALLLRFNGTMVASTMAIILLLL